MREGDGEGDGEEVEDDTGEGDGLFEEGGFNRAAMSILRAREAVPPVMAD